MPIDLLCKCVVKIPVMPSQQTTTYFYRPCAFPFLCQPTYTMTAPSTVSYKVQDLLDKINDIDQDVRFMSFNDLNALLSEEENQQVFATNPSLTSAVATGIIARLNDNISEVQNQAVKW